MDRENHERLCCMAHKKLVVILRLSILVSGDSGFRIWGFVLFGAASFLSDTALLSVCGLSRPSRINGTTGVRDIMVREEGLWKTIGSFVCLGLRIKQVRPRVLYMCI